MEPAEPEMHFILCDAEIWWDGNSVPAKGSNAKFSKLTKIACQFQSSSFNALGALLIGIWLLSSAVILYVFQQRLEKQAILAD